MFFYESRFWSWNDTQAHSRISVNLDGSNEVEQQQPVKNSQQMPSDSTNISPPMGRPQRVRRKPTWIADYEVHGVDEGVNPLMHFALFSYYDPTAFEEVAKELKWKKVMEEEIASIERNDT